LRDHHAEFIGQSEVLGQLADSWRFQRQGKDLSIFYLRVGSGLLLRMRSGDGRCTSVRDFPNLSVAPIPEAVFAVS
jgi:hypothetical protein